VLKFSALAAGALLAFSAVEAVAADAARGQQLYAARCGACHSLTDNGAGPRHAGLFGRRAGTQPGFTYSEALRNSRIVWDARELDRWLARPDGLVPGNKMVVQLATDPRDRADIIEFLREATQPVASPRLKR
jgi:cytochrome c